MKVKEEFAKKLLVEGNDDRHVMLALRYRHNLPKDFDVVDCGSIDNLEKRIPVIFKVSGIEAVGIIIDADENLQPRWCALRSRLSAAGFGMPDKLPKDGLIVENDLHKAGVWIMPDNSSSGMLEDFVSFLIPGEDALLPAAAVGKSYSATFYGVDMLLAIGFCVRSRRGRQFGEMEK